MSSYNVIVPSSLKPRPDKYELMGAELCTEKFQSDIIFVPRGLHNTPDIQVQKDGGLWEIKNIRGNSKHTIEDNLRKAKKQSPNIIISLLRPGAMSTDQALSRIRFYLKNNSTGIDQILLITKNEKIIDIYPEP